MSVFPKHIVTISDGCSEEHKEVHRTNVYLDIFKVILDECIDELNILENMFKQQHLEGQVVVYESLAARFASGEKERREREQYRIDDVYTDYHKLQKEVALIIDILTDVGSDDIQGSDVSLEDLETVVESLEMMKEDDIRLLEDEQLNQKRMNELKNQYIKVHEENRQMLNEVDTRLYFLKFECDRVSTQLNEEIKYVTGWEDSRIEQHLMRLDSAETGYKDILSNMAEKVRNEARCHADVMLYLVSSQETYNQEIEQWMNKYEDDVELYTNDILKLRIKHQQLIEKHENLQLLHERHIEEIAEWKEYKRNKAIEMWQFKIKIRAIEKVQAWWRETMMRCFLGPYKKKKKGKGKGKGKKNKKENVEGD